MSEPKPIKVSMSDIELGVRLIKGKGRGFEGLARSVTVDNATKSAIAANNAEWIAWIEKHEKYNRFDYGTAPSVIIIATSQWQERKKSLGVKE